MDCAVSRPDWGLAHLAVTLDMVDLVQEETFRAQLDTLDQLGQTALSLAVGQGSKHLVAGLVGQGASLAIQDQAGNNVFHTGATGPLVVLDLLAGPKDSEDDSCSLLVARLLNQANKEGNTPLHLACRADRPDTVKRMLCLGADVNALCGGERPLQTAVQSNNVGCVKEILEQFPGQLHTKDIKAGGTPLHWAADKPILEALLSLSCNLEAKNFSGSTALHTQVRHKRLPCIVCLLSHGAAVDQADSEGNTALHLAVTTGHIPSIQALLVFGADYSAVNKSGESVWMLALRSHQSKMLSNLDRERNMILHTLHSIGAAGPGDLSSTPRDFDWKPAVTEKNKTHRRCRALFDEFLDNAALHTDGARKGGARILSLDGGGIRGLVLVKILHCLRDHISTFESDSIENSTPGITFLDLMLAWEE